ncbi:MAG: hypothetical protein ACK5QX_00970 [bacterium]
MFRPQQAGPAARRHYRGTKGVTAAERKRSAAKKVQAGWGRTQPNAGTARGVRREWWRVTEGSAGRRRRGLPATLRGFAGPMRDTLGPRATHI